MDYLDRLAVSYYETVAVINESHNIFLVQHRNTGKFYVKKILDVYNSDVFEQLIAHPVAGTPRIYASCEEENQLIVIEEYIPGTSLEEILNRHSLSLDDVYTYMLDLCDILETLHNFNPPIVHRDIKPSNIIITTYNRAVLLDFNAAKYYSSSSADTVLLGTQGYAAPEQYGFGSSSPQTDIYSLGVILKEMLFGFTDSKMYQIAQKCSQLSPADRYENVVALRKEILLAQNKLNEQKPLALNFSIENDSVFSAYTLPGFRTHTTWKAVLASIYYLLTILISLCIETMNVSAGQLWLNRGFVFLLLMLIPLASCNYRNLHRFMPLCMHKSKPIRLVGVILLDILIVIVLILLLYVIETVLFPTT